MSILVIHGNRKNGFGFEKDVMKFSQIRKLQNAY